eukprot:CAMPEP_0119313308 /NCGR_PEP_ID=MMETSP1333-20130426/28668_1 /TAXON_ID=418940 /ORGANISM="Scyphosphaera apsteinii, Strain RCC1455" /LENGTH=241 /DNA_ID=CAMNT_0007318115 /DNA_START=43 /DNA_END=768 /DNA_ORIENTATION=+
MSGKAKIEAQSVTTDFVELTREDAEDGIAIRPFRHATPIQASGLHELKLHHEYYTEQGNSLIRVSASEALLAGKIAIPVRLQRTLWSDEPSLQGHANNSKCSVGLTGQDLQRLAQEGMKKDHQSQLRYQGECVQIPTLLAAERMKGSAELTGLQLQRLVQETMQNANKELAAIDEKLSSEPCCWMGDAASCTSSVTPWGESASMVSGMSGMSASGSSQITQRSPLGSSSDVQSLQGIQEIT